MDQADVASAFPDWEIRESVGQGGQKTVWDATTPGGRRVALKIAIHSDPRRIRMDRELQAIRLATSPNLVQPESDRVSAASIGGLDCLWYAEEFIEGTLIQDIAAPWELGQIIELGLGLGHAIEALWEHRIVHRDIKPDNVIRATEGRFVLLDAGVARHQTLESITLAEGRPGTAFWRSPEQLRRYRRELDFRSDLFLVGQLMYCSATNAHPFLIDVETEEEYERRVIEGDFTKVEQLREDIPISLAAVINRSLARNPHGRYRAISRFREALEAAREEI